MWSYGLQGSSLFLCERICTMRLPSNPAVVSSTEGGTTAEGGQNRRAEAENIRHS